MGNITEGVKATWLKDIMSRKELDRFAGRWMYEYFDGTGVASQTIRLAHHAHFIENVYVLYDGTSHYEPKIAPTLKQVSSLTAEAYGYTFTEGNLLTFGNGTNGYNPADSSSNKPGLLVVYATPNGEYAPPNAPVTLTWTATTVSDDNAPGTDTAIYVLGSESVGIQFDTTGPVGATTCDLKVIGSYDGTTYQGAGSYIVQPFTAQAITKIELAMVNAKGFKYVKLRADIIGANLGTGKSINAYVTPMWNY